MTVALAVGVDVVLVRHVQPQLHSRDGRHCLPKLWPPEEAIS
jgi:hypothetical protein